MRSLAWIVLLPMASLANCQDGGVGEDDSFLDDGLIQEILSQPPGPARIAAARGLNDPGPEHGLLARLVGRWSAEVEVWPTSDSAEPTLTSVELEAEMILGGRFLRIESGAGTPGERVTILGFDRRWKEFTLLELATSGTHVVQARGGYDPGARRLDLVGADRDPVLEMARHYSYAYDFEDEDTILRTVVLDDASRGAIGPYVLAKTTMRRR